MEEVEQKVRDKFIKKDEEAEQKDEEKNTTVPETEENINTEETDFNAAVITEKADE